MGVIIKIFLKGWAWDCSWRISSIQQKLGKELKGEQILCQDKEAGLWRNVFIVASGISVVREDGDGGLRRHCKESKSVLRSGVEGPKSASLPLLTDESKGLWFAREVTPVPMVEHHKCRQGQFHYCTVHWNPSSCKKKPTKSLRSWVRAWSSSALPSVSEGLDLRLLELPNRSNLLSPSYSSHLVNPFLFFFFFSFSLSGDTELKQKWQ